MDLNLNPALADGYKSPAQRTRLITEGWVHNSVYCPVCGAERLKKHSNNAPVLDFECLSCREGFELKSKRGRLGPRIVDGAYQALLTRLMSNAVPNLFVMTYLPGICRVNDLMVIPGQFFVPSVVERRKRLSVSAQRAGWEGCKIVLEKIPKAGKVFIVENGTPKPKNDVVAAFNRTLFLRETPKVEVRGWTLDVMRCVDVLGKAEFTLGEVYRFESELSRLHPENRHVRDKIRQQLQILRDCGLLAFERQGRYRILKLREN